MLQITGHSDDIIELSGDIDEEIDYVPFEKGGALVACSTGHVFKVEFTDRWHISLLAGWDNRFSVDRDGADGDDTATVNADVSWVMPSVELHRAPKATGR